MMHLSTSTARARDLFCSRVRATAFQRAKLGPFTEPGCAQSVFLRSVQSTFLEGVTLRRSKTLKSKMLVKVNALKSNYLPMVISSFPLDKAYKALSLWRVVPRVPSGVRCLCTHRTNIPCRMVRNDNIFSL